MLSRNRSIHSLILDRTSLGDSGAAMFAEEDLSSQSSLISLSLAIASCDWTRKGMLAVALYGNRGMKEPRLDGNEKLGE